MEHIHYNIQGWFSFEDLYSYIVKKLDNAIFIEVGSWLGRSCTYMAVEIINSKKNIKFYSVDTWEGCKVLKNHRLVKENKLYEEFLINIEPVKNKINILKMSSKEASNLFDNNSIDFCFIDADHAYEDVKQDIEAWYPKIKNRRVLAGHDLPNKDVRRAVEEFCKINNLKLFELDTIDCWLIIKNYFDKK